MPANDKVTDEELELMLEEHSRPKEKPKHRGYGKYERRGIYRGPSVRKDKEEHEEQGSGSC